MKNLFFALTIFVLAGPAFAEGTKESVFDRVMRTQTIRCGIVLWPTYIEKDPNTGKLSGVWYDYMEALARRLNLKIEWMPETTYPQMSEDLKAGRYDVFCGGLWPDISMSQNVDYTVPITYQIIEAFARPDDKRFDNHLDLINKSEVKVSVADGQTPDIIRREDFPASTPVSVPQNADITATLLNVTGGKADVTFNSPETVDRFLENNPGTLRKIPASKPLRLYPEVLAISRGEHDLRQLLNNATNDLLGSGTIDKILKPYEDKGSRFYHVALPYQTPQ